MSDFKVTISRSNYKVYATIPTGLATKPVVYFSHECTSQTEAELITALLCSNQSKKLREIRRAEFFSGWRHAKAKKHGKKFFSWFMGNYNSKATNN